MINIYDVNGRVLMQAEITNSAIREEELSKSDYISLSWNSAEKVVLPVGAYIVHTYKIDKVREVTRQFLLLESYEPTQSDEMAWKYTPEFHHPKMILSKIPFYIRTRNSQNEEIKQHEWSFVGTMNTIANKLKDFLNYEIAFGTAGWDVVYDTANANVVNVSFDNNDFISALTAICNAIGDNCEWHIDYDNEIIYIGKTCIDDGDITLEVGKNVGIPSVNNSKESYYNSFAVFGGTRNITQVNNKGENIASSDIRLQLAPSIGTIDIDGEKLPYTIDKFSTIDIRKDKKEPLFTKVLEFSQIYPSLNTYVYNVRGREKYVIDSETQKKIPLTYNSDGSVATYKTFTVWYMRLAYPTTERIEGKAIVNTTNDNGVVHYWYDFEVTDKLLINGKNLSCSFEANFNKDALSTPLAGRGTNGDYVGFELSYHKEASSSHESDDVSGGNFSVLAGDYEIIYQEDNNLIIPTNESEMIIPRGESKPTYKCNITVLYNIAMAESIYTKDAQKRLFEEAIKEIQRIKSDLNNYSLKSYPQVFEKDNPCLQIGQKVTYNDGNGYLLTTRVLKLSTNIDYNFEQEITIGNEAVKGSITQLKEKVDSIIASGSASNNGGYTTSQLSNLIAKYGTRFFLSKQYNDTAQGVITFLKGIVFGAEELWRITKDGFATLFSLSVKGDTQLGDNGTSTTFGDYKTDTSGAVVKVDKKGVSYMEADYITIRRAADFREITIRELRYIGGELAITPAAMQVSKVERLDASGSVIPQDDTTTEVAAYKCYFETEGTDGQKKLYQEFMPYDQARCQQWGIDAGTSEHVRTKYYWRLVTAVGTDYIILSNKTYDTSTENSEPAVGDNIVQLGYQGENRPNRQSAIILSATSTDAPSQKYYQGIHDFTLMDCVVKDEGYDAAKGTFHTHTYGDSYVGDKDGNGYMKYDSKTKTVTIKGTVHFDSDSTKDGEEIASKADLRDLNIKSGNLLRNTAFCGDYEDIEVSDDLEMTDDSEVYSDKLKYWTLSKAKVVDDADTTSGKAVSLSDGSITQQLTAPLLSNSEYTLSFRGKGTTAYIEVCGVALTQTMDTESRRYELHFSTPAEVSSALFKIKGTSCTISEIMLSYGSLAPAWSQAYSDNDKSLAEFKNIKFLTDAITEGSATVDGGLVMSQQFRVGNYRNKKMIKETGGMSGYYNDDNSPFLWGGGSLVQAIYTIQKYKNDPTYQPTEDEISNMAKFVVTHGGRAILNDIILRGIIYAEGGVMKSVKSPNGNFEIDEQGNASLRGEINATKGSIGGFNINSSYIGSNMRDSEGNVIENSVTKGISIFNDFICFNAKDRQAIMGTWYSNGVPLLLRLIDTEKDFYGRTASVIGVTGGFQYNTAIKIIGGSIDGLNFKNKTVGFNKYQYSESQQTCPDLYEVTLSRDVAFVFVSPRCKWQGKDSETFTDKQQNIVIALPDIHSYDDGHVIVFRRDNTKNPFPNVQKSVILKPARSCRLELKEDSPVYGDERFEDVWYDSFIYTKGGDAVLSYSLSIGETAEFRFFPSNSTTIDNKTYVGMWLEI